MPADMFKVVARFQDADGNPLRGADFTVKLLDEDRFFDDKLGSSPLDDDGVAEFVIPVADIVSFDSPGERTPDIYFIVTKDGREVFRSEAVAEVNFDATNPVTGRSDALTKAFGPFRVAGQT